MCYQRGKPPDDLVSDIAKIGRIWNPLQARILACHFALTGSRSSVSGAKRGPDWSEDSRDTNWLPHLLQGRGNLVKTFCSQSYEKEMDGIPDSKESGMRFNSTKTPTEFSL
jgi:hypothetical protein